MTRREEQHSDGTQAAPVDATDAFLDALSRGEDPSNGSDQLVTMLLELKAEIDQPIASDHVFTPGRTEERTEGRTESFSQPVSLNAARQRRELRGRRPSAANGANGAKPRKRGMSPWAAGLVGAAAASAVLAGTGAALYNATPDSPLWGPATTVFGERAAAVELASTLKQLEVANQEGDSDHADALLRQARELVETMKAPAQGSREGADGRTGQTSSAEPTPKTTTVTVTVTAVPEPPEAAQPQEPTQQSAAPQQPQTTAPQPAPAAPAQPAQPPQPAAPAQPTRVVTSQAEVPPAQPLANPADPDRQDGAPGPAAEPVN